MKARVIRPTMGGERTIVQTEDGERVHVRTPFRNKATLEPGDEVTIADAANGRARLVEHKGRRIKPGL